MKLQLGKNLAGRPGVKSDKLFFRGWIDEVFVADEALSLEQIRELMQSSRLKH
ncbi:hypothetical protein ACFSSA_12820 [Luteolibacter algae]|uniref:Uncharacterized protein n=1 Tax=Luteolibacter algae TaxID=454151 RepID=A0ABW5D8Y9_9BACT